MEEVTAARISFVPTERLYSIPSLSMRLVRIDDLKHLPWIMTFSSLQAFHATPSRHHDRGLTLVFGSDGQVSLIGFDGGIPSQVPHALSASNAGVLTPGTNFVPSEPASVSTVPNLEATSASSSGTPPFTPTPTPTPTRTSTSLSSNYDPSSTTTDTDTNLPSVPTLSFPAPSPTPVSNPRDHGAGAPFYLAIVLASISLVGCVAALIAWWIRSRVRRRDFEIDDPWQHRNTVSDNGSPFIDGANAFEKGAQNPMEPQTRPYYLPASIVRRTSSNLLPVPHAVPSPEEDGILQNGMSRTTASALQYPSFNHANELRSKSLNSESKPSRTLPTSQTPNPHPRPGTGRIQTGLSVQESTRTLGRLRVANRVPGDVTSGDEGGLGINALRSQNYVGLLHPVNAGEPDAFSMEKNAARNPHPEKSGKFVQEDDALLEPPGPATLSWGRRMDTIAALRRTRRRTPGADQTYKSARYSEYVHPTPDEGARVAMSQAPPVADQERGMIQENTPSDPLGWTSTLKSSFWQAVDAMTGSRTPDPESRPENGSRFTPAPQRIASRRSPVSPSRSTTQSPLSDTHIDQSQTEQTLLDKSLATQETLQNSTHPDFGNPSATKRELEALQVGRVAMGGVGSGPPRISRLNRDLGENAHPRHPDSLRTDTGSVYSTDSAAARANLRKYGYGDSAPIPSSWSALARIRESQLDLDRPFLPPSRPVSRSSRTPLSITPSQLTLASGLLSSSRTPVHSESDLVNSDANTLRSGKSANTTNYVQTPNGSLYSVSRNGTVQSGHGTLSHESVPSHSSSTTSSMLSRKKGVTRKRPRPPPRAPSSASSMHSIESGLSTRDVAVRRALLERRKKVKAAESLKGREDISSRSSDVGSLQV